MTSRQSRLLRAAAASGVATILAAVSHTFGGGLPPHPLLILALAVLSIPVSAVLIGARPSRGRTAAAVIAAQLAFHLVFHFLGGTISTDAAAHVGHGHEIVLGQGAAVAAPDALMLFAHALAALVTTLLLWHGERMLREIGVWAAGAVAGLWAVALCFAPPRHAAVPAPAWRIVLVRRAAPTTSLSRRGPPQP